MRELSQRHPEDRWVFITLTAKVNDEPLRTRVNRVKDWFKKLRRRSVWKTSIRGAVAGYEVTYHHGRGWHVHVHLLASRQAWIDQATLARAWQRVTDGRGEVVDIRDRDADVRSSMCRTLTYPFKPTNLAAWGPAQIAEFTALGRTKLAECYGALRGLAAALADDSEETEGSPHRQGPGRILSTGAPCPSCGAPLVAQWYTAEEVHWAQRLATHRPQAPPDRSQAA
jgi:hypothetical protein